MRNITFIIYYRNSSVVVDLLWERYHVLQNVFLVFDSFEIFCLLFFCVLLRVLFVGSAETHPMTTLNASVDQVSCT